MTQKTIAIGGVLMAAALTGIFGTVSLTVYAGQSAYAEDDCENQVVLNSRDRVCRSRRASVYNYRR